MTIREAFEQVLQEYPSARSQEFANNQLAIWIRHEFPQILAQVTPSYKHLKWVASPGQGQWADAPWAAALDPLVTETPQEGYYPVYLFTKSLDAVYLSLNQGMAHLREELGAEAKTTLTYRASILRTRLYPTYEERFKASPIDLNPNGSQTRLAFYEAGHAFGICYSKGALPTENYLVNDLLHMLKLYEKVTALGGSQELDTTGQVVTQPGGEGSADTSLEEKRQLRFHYRIERNSRLARLAKEVHGYCCQVCEYDFQSEYGELGKG